MMESDLINDREKRGKMAGPANNASTFIRGAFLSAYCEFHTENFILRISY